MAVESEKMETSVEFEVELADGVSDCFSFDIDPDLGVLAILLQLCRKSMPER